MERVVELTTHIHLEQSQNRWSNTSNPQQWLLIFTGILRHKVSRYFPSTPIILRHAITIRCYVDSDVLCAHATVDNWRRQSEGNFEHSVSFFCWVDLLSCSRKNTACMSTHNISYRPNGKFRKCSTSFVCLRTYSRITFNFSSTALKSLLNQMGLFFYVSLTVHFSITLDNDQLNSQILIHLLWSSTFTRF